MNAETNKTLYAAALLCGLAALGASLLLSGRRYSVVVRNRGGATIQTFVVVNSRSGKRTELGPIGFDEKKKASLRIKGKTSLSYEMSRGGQASTGTVCADADDGQWSFVTVLPGGRTTVDEMIGSEP